MTTRAERREQRELRARMKARFPACRHCRRPVVAGQTDPWGVPAHLMCSQSFDKLSPDHPARRFTGPPKESR